MEDKYFQAARTIIYTMLVFTLSSLECVSILTIYHRRGGGGGDRERRRILLIIRMMIFGINFDMHLLLLDALSRRKTRQVRALTVCCLLFTTSLRSLQSILV